MAANVLAQGNDAVCEMPKRRCMNRPRLDVEFLQQWYILHRNHDLLRRELPAAPDNGRGTYGFCDRFDAAQSAPCRSCNMPPTLPQTIGFWFTEPHPQFDTVIERYNVQGLDICSRADDALAQAEADRKILQVLRRRHHHRMGAAVIGKRHSGLFRDRTTAQAETAFPPNLVANDSGRFLHQLLRCIRKPREAENCEPIRQDIRPSRDS